MGNSTLVLCMGRRRGLGQVVECAPCGVSFWCWGYWLGDSWAGPCTCWSSPLRVMCVEGAMYAGTGLSVRVRLLVVCRSLIASPSCWPAGWGAVRGDGDGRLDWDGLDGEMDARIGLRVLAHSRLGWVEVSWAHCRVTMSMTSPVRPQRQEGSRQGRAPSPRGRSRLQPSLHTIPTPIPAKP